MVGEVVQMVVNHLIHLEGVQGGHLIHLPRTTYPPPNHLTHLQVVIWSGGGYAKLPIYLRHYHLTA
jgi:hypothetical protein